MTAPAVVSAAVPAIEVEALVKVYPGGTRAVDGIDVTVERGEFFAFLGPNGAGKTTTIRILTTLLRATSGHARVLGLDVGREAGTVRRRIGFAMQTVALESLATGRENLEIVGHLHRVPAAELRQRVDELLDLMGLSSVAGKLAGTYSGGMRRRLDLATALVHRPDVLFLDEPTEGLDPQSRSALWDELARINREGTTMLLTTHYMEEADRLCARLAIIDAGRIAVAGTPAELKRAVGADTVTLRLAATDGASTAGAQASAARRLEGFEPLVGLEAIEGGIRLAVHDAEGNIPALLRRLDGDDLHVIGVALEQPDLDDVFLRHTGRHIREEAADQPLELGW
ncbi:MAG: ATP-binding cassette domain-containing protein [Candidatus Limnocylindrales bacterium]